MAVAAGALAISGGAYRVVHGPFGHRDACGHSDSSTASLPPQPLVVLGSGPAYSSGKVRSAVEAEDALVTPPSRPARVVIDSATIARLRAVTARDLTVTLSSRNAKILVAPCRR